jgi:hypothetical protein
VNKALSHGLKQKNWGTLKLLLENLDIKISDEDFVELTDKLTREKSMISLEPLRKKKGLLQGIVSASAASESASTEEESPGGKVKTQTEVAEKPSLDQAKEKFVKNFNKIESKLMELRVGKYTQTVLQAWLVHLETVRGLYKDEFNMAGKIRELDITIEIIRNKLKEKR